MLRMITVPDILWPITTIVFGIALCVCVPYLMRARKNKIKDREEYSNLVKELLVVPLSNTNAVLSVDNMGYVKFANHSAEIMMMQSEGQSITRIPLEWREVVKQILLSKRPQTIEASSKERAYVLSVIPINQNRVYIFGTDVTQFKNLEKELVTRKTIDEETKLPNRISFNQMLEKAQAHAKEKDGRFSLLLIRIDDYSNLVFSYGQKMATQILIDYAERLKNVVGKNKTLARYSENVFSIIKTENIDITKLASYLEMLLERTTFPFEVSDRKIAISISIGVAMYPSDSKEVDGLERDANLALNRTDETKNAYEFFQRGMEEQLQMKRDIIADLHLAIEEQQLELFYQPQIDISQNKLIGCEALIRWKHPTKGYISPFFFIPAAEESNLIHPIGEWILKEACSQIAKWKNQGLAPFKVSVNLSAHQILNPGTMSLIRRVTEEDGITPDWLGFELTESALVQDQDKAIDIMKRIKTLGYDIALDDFGTGYSSLSYLLQFPIDKLKIDRSFVKIIDDHTQEYAVTKSIIELGYRMKLDIIVEGVETKNQLTYFKTNDCHIIQGYIFGKPEPAHVFEQYLEKDWLGSIKEED